MKKLMSSLAILSLLVFSVSAQASIVQIDTFTAGNNLSQFGAGTNTQTTTDSSILGGARDESVTVRNLGGDEVFGLYSYGNGWNVAQGVDDQIFGGLTYDNFTDFDLTSNGSATTFAIDVTSFDSTTPVQDVIDIVVESNGITQSVGVDFPGNTTLPSTVLVSFSDFTNIDFTQVDSIGLEIDFQDDPGRDFEISNFRTVPEPSSAVLGLGLLGGFFLRRRRKA